MIIKNDDTQSMTQDIVNDNIEQLKKLFPEVFPEDRIDFEALQSLLGEYIDKEDERYSFNWKGKANARRIAQTPSTATLRPAKEESKNWDKTENLYIEGDNLEVLKLLQKSYHKKVKMIYIDPPYNTGKDILYKNDFSNDLKTYLSYTGQIDAGNLKLSTNTETNGRYHSDWISMMYSRIKIARNLLKDDGIIVIAIDHYELFNLGQICNEIFGEENQLGVVSVIHKPEGRNQEKFFGSSNEFMLVYARDRSLANFNKVILDIELSKKYNESDENGNYRLQNFIRLTDGKLAYRDVRPNFWYPIYVDNDNLSISIKEKENSVPVYPVTSSGIEMSWKTLPDTLSKTILEGNISAKRNSDNSITIYEKIRESQVIKTHWIRKEYNAIQYGTKVLNDLLKSKTFDFPKSVFLLEDIVKLTTSYDDIILDFFSGSATTAHAVIQLNAKDGMKRKFIMVQIPELTDQNSEANKSGYANICEIGKERIRRAGDKIVKELKEKQSSQKLLTDEIQVNPDDLDTGFKVFKLDTSNIKTWDSSSENIQQVLLDSVSNIKPERSQEDVLYEVLLKYGLDLTLPIEEFEQDGKKLYSVGFGSLIICLDDDIDISIAEKIVEIKDKKNPETMNVIFKDNGFKDDVVKTNMIQLLKKHEVESVRSI